MMQASGNQVLKDFKSMYVWIVAFLNFRVEFIHLTRITEYIHNPLKSDRTGTDEVEELFWSDFVFNPLKTQVIVDPSCHCSQSCNMLTSKTLLNFITTLSDYEFTSTYQQLKMDISSTTLACFYLQWFKFLPWISRVHYWSSYHCRLTLSHWLLPSN